MFSGGIEKQHQAVIMFLIVGKYNMALLHAQL